MISQVVQAEREQSENLAAIVGGLVGEVDRYKRSTISQEQLAELVRKLEAQSARIESVEKGGAGNAAGAVSDVDERFTELQTLLLENSQALEGNIHQQAAAIQSLRGAISQTDDTVERVIEALECLQESIMDHNANR
jgi:hypothetical protein